MRDDFIDWLARLVSDGAITEDEALRLLQEYDKGTFIWDAPLPIRDAIQEKRDPAIVLASLVAAIQSRGGDLLGNLAPIPTGARTGVLDALQAGYKRRAMQLARDLTQKQLGVAAWQQGMADLIAREVQQAALLAHGRERLTAAELQRLQGEIARQHAYLSRFADSLSLRPQSEAYVFSRSDLYGNAIRSVYWQESELEFVGQGGGRGWLLQWEARDDGRVCPNCVTLDGQLFIPGTAHPYPGQPGVCFGRCRCRFRYVFDPLLAATLQ